MPSPPKDSGRRIGHRRASVPATLELASTTERSGSKNKTKWGRVKGMFLGIVNGGQITSLSVPNDYSTCSCNAHSQ